MKRRNTRSSLAVVTVLGMLLALLPLTAAPAATGDPVLINEVLASQNKMIQRLGTEDSTAAEEAMKEAYRNDIVRTRLLCKNRPNFELIEVNYKNTIEDPTATARSVNTFVGGHLNETAMREAVDGSLYRNRGEG